MIWVTFFLDARWLNRVEEPRQRLELTLRFLGQTDAQSSLRMMESAMFQTIDEQIESTEGGRPTMSSRLARFTGIAVVLLVFFAGLYFAIVSFE